MRSPAITALWTWSRTLVLLAVWCPWPGPLNAAEPTHASRTCTDEEHRALKQEVGRACKTTGMKCYEHQSCAELIANWLTHQRCIAARITIMDKCFNGGDKDHKQEVDNYRVGAAACSNIMALKRCPQQCR